MADSGIDSGIELTHDSAGEYFRFDDESGASAPTGLTSDDPRPATGEYESSVHHLDLFLTRLYVYYADHGFGYIVAQCISNVFTTLFAICFFVFLTLYVQWGNLLVCGGTQPEDSPEVKAACANLFGFHVSDSTPWRRPRGLDECVWVATSCFGVYWLCTVWAMLRVIRQTRTIRNFYRDILHLSDAQLQAISWCQVVERMTRLQIEGRLPMIRKSLNHLSVVNRIMRTDNFFIALINGDACELRGREWRFSTALRWNLQRCVLQSIFNEDCSLNRTFLGAPQQLQRKFEWAGLINLLLMPFIVLYVLMIFVFKNVQEFYSQRDVFGPRRWTNYAKWQLREFNELPHLLQHRLEVGAEHTQRFLDQFPNYALSKMLGNLIFVCGAFVAILVIFTVTYSNVLVRVRVLEFTLLWYLGVFMSIIAVARAYIAPAANKSREFYTRKLFARVCKWTHYTPAPVPEQKQSTHPHPTNVAIGIEEDTADNNNGDLDLDLDLDLQLRTDPQQPTLEQMLAAKRDLQVLYRPKIWILLQELLGIFVTPFLLMFWLPKKSARILAFLNDVCEESPDFGVVCKYALFEQPQTHPLEASETDRPGLGDATERLLVDSALADHADEIHESKHNFSRAKSADKISKSVLYFQHSNPLWRPSLHNNHKAAAPRPAHQTADESSEDGVANALDERTSVSPTAGGGTLNSGLADTTLLRNLSTLLDIPTSQSRDDPESSIATRESVVGL